MDSLPVYDPKGEQVGTVELNAEFSRCVVKPSLVHQAVVMQRAGERQGTVSTKGRGEVRGSGKKPWKQKHTGRARAGSARSPIWRHGGTVFGPKPRSYSFTLPKKMYHSALRSALKSRMESGDVVVLDGLQFPEMKTRYLAQAMTQLGLASHKSVLVLEEALGDVVRIGNNLKSLKVLHAKDLNVYDVLWCEKLVVTKTEFQQMQELWGVA